MPITNNEIATAFEQIADYLQSLQDNPFKIKAYRKAARSIRKLPKKISDMVYHRIVTRWC